MFWRLSEVEIMSNIEVKTVNCGSCGAPLEVRSAFTRSVICPFCDSTNMLDDKSVDVSGKMAKISKARSVFSIGRTGTMNGIRFEVLGRLRYGYEDGYWDEWFLQFEDGKCSWITEEEGELTIFSKNLLTTPVENIDRIRVGQFIQVGDKKIFVTEITDCTIEGGEGELHYRVIPGKEVLHLEGNAAGSLVSIEVWPREIELHIGEPMQYKEIQWDMQKDSDI
jgi:hypothetical protein